MEQRVIANSDISRSNTIKIGYTVTHGWEHATSLSNQQLSLTTLLSTYYGRYANLKKARTRASLDITSTPLDSRILSSVGHTPIRNQQIIVQDAQKFHAWYSTIDATLAHEVDEKYKSYAYKLTRLCSTCEILLKRIFSACQNIYKVIYTHSDVEKRGEILRNDCQRLIREKEYLSEFAEAIMSKLVFFYEIDIVTGSLADSPALVNSSTIDESSLSDFVHLLEHLDSCIDFIDEHRHYAGGNGYTIKLQQLRGRTLASIRFRFIAILREIKTSITRSTLNAENYKAGKVHMEDDEKNPIQEITAPDELVTSTFYVKYATFTLDLKCLILEIEKRSKKSEYKMLINDCHGLYCEERAKLLNDTVRRKIREMMANSTQDIQTLTRSGVSFLIELAIAENHLFRTLFTAIDQQEALVPLMNTLGGNVYELAKLVEIIKDEIAEGKIADVEDALFSLSPILSSILADVQERMIYRTQTFLRDEVGNYVPSGQDIDYPNNLSSYNTSMLKASFEVSIDTSLLYPPLEKTLKCLSSLYCCVESTTFSGLAQEAVSLCTDNITLASKAVSRNSGVLDGQLFLIKHLLFLREQIAPFDAEFAIGVKELDFSHLRGQMHRIFSGELSLFSISQNNALLVLASEGRPQVLESTINSKKELEKKLKVGCEAFIMSFTKIIVEPMLRFITKVTVFRLSEERGKNKKLSASAFGSEKRVTEVINGVNIALETLFIPMVNSLKMYIPGKQTQALLFGPICSNILEAHAQFCTVLEEEYTDEKLRSFGMIDASGLSKLFHTAL